MELCPGEDESQLAATEAAVHDLQVVDPHLGFSFGMASMEVREAVIVQTFRFCASLNSGYEGDTEAGLTDCRSQVDPVSPMQTFAPHGFA